MFVELAKAAAKENVLMMLTAHRLFPADWPGKGLWYDDTYTENIQMQLWGMLAKELCSQWNVIGVDLFNEPHKATWCALESTPNHPPNHPSARGRASRTMRRVSQPCPTLSPALLAGAWALRRIGTRLRSGSATTC